MRQPIIAGNWKMNNTIAEAKTLIEELIPLVKDAKAEVVVCAPYTALAEIAKLCKGSNIKVGAENVAWADKGAFTGEISAAMLKEVGTEYVIIGHSERRQYFGETDKTVNARLVQSLKFGLKPIVCVGETLAQREADKTCAVCSKQIKGAYKGMSAADAEKTVIAYEPVWAIGTGKTATSEQAQETVGYIRSVMAKLYGDKTADIVRIQYGGSMNPLNVAELMSQKDIDGGLIGGASLKAADFTKVVKY